MPTPLAGGLENSFASQMIFLWPPARGVILSSLLKTTLYILHDNDKHDGLDKHDEFSCAKFNRVDQQLSW